MTSRGRSAQEDFSGIALDAHRAKLPAGKVQEDKGSDHYERGIWKVRRGQERLNTPQAGADINNGEVTTNEGYPICTIWGWPLAGGIDHGLIWLECTVGLYYADTNVESQYDVEADEEGFGEGGFGEGGFGE